VLRALWARGETAFGTMITSMRHPAAMPIMAEAGFDFVVLDCEHGSFGYGTVEDMMLASRGTGITPIVRIPEVRREPILKYLEAGVHGILAPQIELQSQVETLVACARYAPDGERGVSLMRPHSAFRRRDPQEYMREANQRNLVVLQIESKRAIDNLDALLSVPGVDAALVGPNDLSQSLTDGRHDDPQALSKATHAVVEAAAKHGIISGIHCSNLNDVVYWQSQGMRLCMWSSDVTMLMTQAREGLAVLHRSKTRD
jgi:2-keto-3-deoxy-L-rhamnonate aldolase RhmA